MKRYLVILVALFACFQIQAMGQDVGKESVGKLKVSLYFATNGDPSAAGDKAKKVDDALVAKFSSSSALKFKHYLLLGSDSQPILRSYENWIAPMKPSEEILLSFEPRGQPKDDQLSLDLEFWQSRKKIMKSGPHLKVGKPLYILGPSWRGGKLLVAVELLSIQK